MPTIAVNGAELYYERQGSGRPLLLIAGGGLDADTLAPLAEILAPEFSVLTYDRRGLSRSPRPKGWNQTSIEEQADDAAGLLRATTDTPAAVVGGSLGALIALELVVRHPDVVRAASLLDTGPVDSVIPDRRERMPMPDSVRAVLGGGGSTARREAFAQLLRFLGIWDTMSEPTHQRITGNADVFFDIETPLLGSYRPNEAQLRANRIPVQVVAGESTQPIMREMSEWLASRLAVPVTTVSGGHVAYMERPDEVAEVIRPFLRHVSAQS